MRKNSILLILNIPPPFGGGEIRAKILYDYFVNKPQLHIVTNFNSKHNKAKQGKISLGNIINNFKYQLNNSFSIIKIQPKVVYVSIPKGFFPLLKILPILLSSKIVSSKLVGELAGSQFFFLDKNYVVRTLGKVILKRFYQIRLLGNSIKKKLKFHGIINTIVFDNGTDVPNYTNNKHKSIDNSLVQISFIGALHKNKGIYLLCEIAKLLEQKGVTYQMNIIGEWENQIDKNAIVQIIQSSKLDSKIIFHGLLHGKSKWQALKKTDIYLFPSFNEGQPISIIEAMAMGVPVITSNVGAIPDSVTNEENGFVLETQDPALYVEKIISLIENPKLYYRISEQNLKTYKERFTVEIYCKSVEKWLTNI